MAIESLRRRVARLEQSAGPKDVSQLIEAEIDAELAEILRQLPEADRAIHAAFEAKGDVEGEIRSPENELCGGRPAAPGSGRRSPARSSSARGSRPAADRPGEQAAGPFP
ncbi:hypothetical protein LNKW23_41340 [Paralimibaculum aggregatum]|uniref:Uncharacterized protein n=1 Tax=Paralimibaculum aggregatum TaxID=3036245 RepID=A0ABQ6LP32_9RHOB|nr:hypothetical protein [Limibaculum sp. NKW23]GMG84918.1 hypothetical protein LNKW23_41340 [Limibaculum sp. NKW23]